jgi:hypothetical protein
VSEIMEAQIGAAGTNSKMLPCQALIAATSRTFNPRSNRRLTASRAQRAENAVAYTHLKASALVAKLDLPHASSP